MSIQNINVQSNKECNFIDWKKAIDTSIRNLKETNINDNNSIIPKEFQLLEEELRKTECIKEETLIYAIKKKSPLLVKWLLDYGAEFSNSSVNSAIKTNNVEALKLLLEKGITLPKYAYISSILLQKNEITDFIVHELGEAMAAIQVAMILRDFDMLLFLIKKEANLEDIVKSAILINPYAIKFLSDQGIELPRYASVQEIELSDSFTESTIAVLSAVLDHNIKIPYDVFKGAIILNNFDVLNFYCSKSAYIDSIKKNEDAVSLAVTYDHFDMVKYLISEGFVCGENSLTNAAGLGNLELIKYLYKEKCHPVTDIFVRVAARYNQTEVIKWLVDIGYKIDINKKILIDEFVLQGNFHLAELLYNIGARTETISYEFLAKSKINKEEVIHFLAGKGAKFCTKAVEQAAINKDYPIMKLLIEYGAEISELTLASILKEKEFEIALYILSKAEQTLYISYELASNYQFEHLDFLNILMENGLKMNPNVFELALKNYNDNLINYLIEKKWKINIFEAFTAGSHNNWDVVKRLEEEDTTLLVHAFEGACSTGNRNMVEYLLPKMENISDRAVEFAAGSGDIEMISFLLNKGAIISPYAISNAAKHGHLNVIEFLVDKGATFTSYDITIALDHDFPEIVLFFLEKGVKPDHHCLSAVLCKDNTEMLKTLIDYGLEFPDNIRENFHTYLQWCEQPSKKTIELINNYLPSSSHLIGCLIYPWGNCYHDFLEDE